MRGNGQTMLEKPSAGSLRVQKERVLVEDTPFTEEELARYSYRLLEASGVKKGDVVCLELSNDNQRKMIDSCVDAAYQMGVLVEVLVNKEEDSPQVLKEQVTSLEEGNGVLISMQTFSGENYPVQDLYQNFEKLDQKYKECDLRWNISMWPSKEWAQKVYPEKSGEDAYQQLGQDLLQMMRASKKDHKDSWQEHVNKLKERASFLNEKSIKSLRFVSENTNIKVDVDQGASFLPASWQTSSGEACVNTPTEEIFTTPNMHSATGKFVSSKPFIIEDYVIDQVECYMLDGEIVSLKGGSEEETSILRQVFSEKNGLTRLGEVGLCDQDNPIAQTKRTYYNNIIDENTGCHFGFGDSYSVAGGQGNSDSLGHHFDLTIGNNELQVKALTESGEELLLIDNGKWQI